MAKRKKSQPLIAQKINNKLDDINKAIERNLFGTKEQQAFLEDMATLVEDGVPANKAIEVMCRVSEGASKTLAENIAEKIAEGRPIADGMVNWFATHIVELIRVGEEGGTIAQNVRVGAESLGARSQVLSSVAGSITYPLVVIIMGCGVIVYMDHTVFPQFELIKPIAQWPADGRRLVEFARFLKSFWWTIILACAGIFIGVRAFLYNVVGPMRRVVDRLPVIRLYRILIASTFMESLGILILNGVVFKKSLKLLSLQANIYLSWHLHMMERKLGKGRGNIADVLDTGLIDDKDIIRLRAIAQAKGFEHALVRLGKQAGKDAIQTLQKFGRILGGLLMAGAAGLAGFMIMALYNTGSSLAT